MQRTKPTRYRPLWTALGIAMFLASCARAEEPSRSAGYDPAADPVADLVSAVQESEASGRRILLEVGGEWCSWCHILEKYIHSTPEVAEALEANFVVLKVNYSEENENTEFLSQYPAIEGYPHMFVLESDGTLLHSQNTGDLESGRGYDTEEFLAFLTQWAPARK